MKEHPICLMNKCPNYPCRILDSISDRAVICKEGGFWNKYDKAGIEEISG
jgi:hypothetical protein